MVGYKGIILNYGILKSKYEQKFELGIEAQKVAVDDGIAFSEAGYSFCGTMEEVLLHMNYLDVSMNKAKLDIRLFEIETLGKVIGNSAHYKAESIILKREVVAEEIVRYFSTNKFTGKIGRIVSEYLPRYIEHPTKPYKECQTIQDIEDIMVGSCLRLGQEEVCMQKQMKKEYALCKLCIGYEWSGDPGSYEEVYEYLFNHIVHNEKSKC